MWKESIYEIDLSFSSRDDAVIRKIFTNINRWKQEYWEEVCNYIYRNEKEFASFLWFSFYNKNLVMALSNERHARVICNILWIKMKEGKYHYVSDYFQLF